MLKISKNKLEMVNIIRVMPNINGEIANIIRVMPNINGEIANIFV